MIKEDTNCAIEKVSDRIAVAKVAYKSQGNIKLLRFINVYAPPRSRSKTYKTVTEKLYKDLENILNTGSVYQTFICGDFNVNVGQQHKNYPDNIGPFNKGKATSDSDHLLGLLQRHNLYVTNTCFQHKLSKITTWQADYIRKDRRNPIRSQIDFIISHRNWRISNTNSRSYSELHCSTDHRLVISKFTTNWRLVFGRKTTTKNIQVQHLSRPDLKEEYRNSIKNSITSISAENSSQSKWKNICEICITASENLKPENPKRTATDDDITTLSEVRKRLHTIIQSNNDSEKIRALKNRRNQVKCCIRKILKRQENKKVLELIETVENSKNDSRRMFKAIEAIKCKSAGPLKVTNKQGDIVNSRKQQIEVISEYFESVFHPPDAEPFPEISPQKLQTPFTQQEITNAIRALKNNKSAGIDKLKAEHLKSAPVELHKIIADILNHACETGQYPEEITKGLLTPIQKPGKLKGPPQNLRPVILLSTLRKILAICVVRRISEKLFGQIIPPTQAAYRPGRNTTELVFSFRTLIEKAITSENYEIHLLLLDMSAAFDRIKRNVLIEDLKDVLEPDELYLVTLLLQQVKIAIKLQNEIGPFFDSVIGSPQGDSASAIFFITYLARSKRIHPNLLFDQLNRLVFLLEQQYSDDVSFAATNKNILDDIKQETIDSLKARNLK